MIRAKVLRDLGHEVDTSALGTFDDFLAGLRRSTTSVLASARSGGSGGGSDGDSRAGEDRITLGRQRINLDDQRWVGSVGWRQNEQTFDAVRVEASLGPLALDVTHAIDQRTIFGEDAAPRASLNGDFLFAGAAANAGPVRVKAFAYLVGYEEPFALANSSQTYGAILSGAIPLGGERSIVLRASHARQSDLGANPVD